MNGMLTGRSDGETVWLAMVGYESQSGDRPIKAQTWVHEATVFSAEHDLIRLGPDRQPRPVYRFSETVHSTAEDAWRHVAGVHQAASNALLVEVINCRRQAEIAASVEVA